MFERFLANIFHFHLILWIDYDVETDLVDYGIDLAVFTMGCGVLLAVIMGMIMCVFCIYWFGFYFLLEVNLIHAPSVS